MDKTVQVLFLCFLLALPSFPSICNACGYSASIVTDVTDKCYQSMRKSCISSFDKLLKIKYSSAWVVQIADTASCYFAFRYVENSMLTSPTIIRISPTK